MIAVDNTLRIHEPILALWGFITRNSALPTRAVRLRSRMRLALDYQTLADLSGVIAQDGVSRGPLVSELWRSVCRHY
jgi:hypothetical protein